MGLFKSLFYLRPKDNRRMQSGVQDHLNTFWESGNYELILQTINLQIVEKVGEIWRGGLETWEYILKRQSFWYAAHTLPSWGCCGREVSSLLQIKQNGLQRDKMEIPLWFSAFCRTQLTGVWDRLEVPKSKMLWLEHLALTGGEGITYESFLQINLGPHVRKKLALNYLRSCPCSRGREGKERSSEKGCKTWWKSGADREIASQEAEQMNSPSSTGLMRSLRAGALQRTLNVPHEWG